MATTKAALEAVTRALKIQHALRAKAVRRMTARHKEQEKAEKQAAAARTEADKLRAEAHHLNTYGPDENPTKAQRLVRKAERKDAKAQRLDAKAVKAKNEAINFKRAARRKTQQIEKLEVRSDQLHKKVEAMAPHVGKDGRVAGAKSTGEAFIFANRYVAAKCASGDRPNFYSMEGPGFNVKHPLLKGSQPHIGQLEGERSDCSLFGTEACWAAKLPDPNALEYKAGYTGSALAAALAGKNGWKVVSEEAMRKHGWGIVIYLRWPGDTIGHHWEDYVGEGGDETIGHGSAPVDPGVIDLFGDGLFACLIHEPKKR